MLTIQQFSEQYNKDIRWLARQDTAGKLAEGMLLFTESAAARLQAYVSNYAYGVVRDMLAYYQAYRPTYVLPTKEDLIQKHRFSQYRFPTGQYKTPAENEEHLQLRLAKLTHKQLVDWERHPLHIEQATRELPFSMYLAGCDDSSYTKWYPTKEAALEEWELFKLIEPIDVEDFISNGFVFTN